MRYKDEYENDIIFKIRSYQNHYQIWLKLVFIVTPDLARKCARWGSKVNQPITDSNRIFWVDCFLK